MRNLFVKLIKIYQRYITVLSFGSCRYYPSCSEYAKQQFIKNNFLVAIFQSTLRILRCNQLFRGGIDYPVVACNKLFSVNKLIYRKIEVEFWFVPKNKKYCYVIKQFNNKVL